MSDREIKSFFLSKLDNRYSQSIDNKELNYFKRNS